MVSGTKSSHAITPLPGAGPRDDEIELGRVAGVFGVRGEVRLHLHHRESDLLRRPRKVVLIGPEGQRVQTRLVARPGAGKRVIGRLDGVGSREQAHTWMHWSIYVPASELPPPKRGEFYVWEVEGLPVHVGGVRVGEVVTVHGTEGGDVFEIATEGGAVFVPSIRELVLDLDLEARRLELAPQALED